MLKLLGRMSAAAFLRKSMPAPSEVPAAIVPSTVTAFSCWNCVRWLGSTERSILINADSGTCSPPAPVT